MLWAPFSLVETPATVKLYLHHWEMEKRALESSRTPSKTLLQVRNGFQNSVSPYEPALSLFGFERSIS